MPAPVPQHTSNPQPNGPSGRDAPAAAPSTPGGAARLAGPAASGPWRSWSRLLTITVVMATAAGISSGCSQFESFWSRKPVQENAGTR